MPRPAHFRRPPNPDDRRATGRPRRALFVALLVVLLVPSVALASHFGDVPAGHPFHDEISAVAEAGISTGYPDGTFRPGAPVTRQAMAAFLGRGLGRAALSEQDGAVPLAPSESRTVARVTVDAGATGSGTGFVLVTGTATASDDEVAGCPCELEARVIGPHGASSGAVSMHLADTLADTGRAATSATVTHVFPIAADGTSSYLLEVTNHDGDTIVGGVSGMLTAVYVPFGPTGGSTLGVGSD